MNKLINWVDTHRVAFVIIVIVIMVLPELIQLIRSLF